MARRLVYRGNLIIEFAPTCFHAFILNQDDDVEDKAFKELPEAKKWIDKNSKKEYGI